MESQGWDAWLERIDWVLAARGAGTGFGILVIATLVQPLLLQVNPWLAPLVLLVGYVAGFVLAAWRSGVAPSPPLTGAVAALFAYTLTIPLIFINRQPIVWTAILGYCAAAVLVGGATGWAMGRRAAV